jgi:large subunit ribosomal protein L5
MRHLGKGQQFHRVGSIDSFFFLPNFYLQSRLQLIHKKMTPYEKYLKYVLCYDLIIKRNLQNPMDLPKIHKVVLNTTTKEFIKDKRSIIPMLSAMEMIVGQKIHPTWTKKSIANFQIRQNQLVGCCVHLRGDNMYNFLYRLINIVLPRIGDEIAQLTMTSTWNTEALSFSLENLLIFPELAPHFSYFSNLQPINITIVFSKLHKNDKSFVLPKKD